MQLPFFLLARNNTAKNTTCNNKTSDKISRGKNAYILFAICYVKLSFSRMDIYLNKL